MFKKCKMRYLITCLFLCSLLNVFAHADSIEKITLKGNQKISRATVLFYMKSVEKGTFSKTMLREDFRSLWKTGFFENITIESSEGSTGKIVTVSLKENPVINSIKYTTGKKVKEKDIQQKLLDNNISIPAFSYFNPGTMKKVERTILLMLKEKGYTEGHVKVTSKKENDQVAISIDVHQGTRTRIGRIVFPGIENTPLSAGFLQGGMKTNKPHNLLSTIGGKDVYNKDNITQDLEDIKLRLHQKGFLEAKVGSPAISKFIKPNVFGKSQHMIKISIPVIPGPQYKTGSVSIKGNKIVRSDFLKTLISMEKGKIYNVKKRNKIIESIQQIYRSQGHIYCMVTPKEDLDPVSKIATLTLNISEGEKAYMGKLEFKGNTFTRDKVIRREWFLREGDRLNMPALERCLTRMKQLGLVSVEKMPEFKPDPLNPKKVDVNVDVKEIDRQSINFQVGTSGYSGLFLALGYSTKNFMGMGETLSLDLQTGTRASRYSLSFSEPYFFELPVGLGASLHQTSTEYPLLYKRKSKGFGFNTSARIYGFWRASLGYNYADVKTVPLDTNYTDDNPYLYSGVSSSLSPTIYYSTIDSPIFPTRGFKLLLNYKYSGGFLGGETNLHKSKLQLVKIFPLWKKHALGFQLVQQWVTGFGGKDVPIWEKFLLGGENSIRGFEVYSIGPRNENYYNTGGNKAFFLNLEYRIPINQQLSFNLFYDTGNTYDFGVPVNLKDLYSSMGAEVKIFVPMLNVPFRLIFAYNPRTLGEGDSNFSFRFAVGTSFQ
ncbi:MAG: outer membrane protein assembly factor BamA [bacterium]|nr:outer membrane protein assembly factor BamA [bacterium]